VPAQSIASQTNLFKRQKHILLPNYMKKIVSTAILLFWGTWIGLKAQKNEHLPSDLILRTENVNHSSVLSNDSFPSSALENHQLLLLRFAQMPDHALRQEMRKDGIRLTEYLGNQSYRALISKNLSEEIWAKYRIESMRKSDENKLDTRLAQKDIPAQAYTQDGRLELEMLFEKGLVFQDIALSLKAMNIEVVEVQDRLNWARIRLSELQIPLLIQKPWLAYLALPSTNSPLDLPGQYTVRANFLREGGRNLSGKGVKVAVIDQGNVDPHLDFGGGRLTRAENSVSGSVLHSTHVASILGGRGIIDPISKGVATDCELYSYDYYGSIVNKMLQAADYGVVITQNSYGINAICAGAPYDYSRKMDDELVGLYPQLVHLYAVGNAQTSCGGYRNTQGSVGKNVISVGGSFLDDNMSNSTSRGPSLDGRIFPHIVTQSSRIYGSGLSNGYYTTPGVGTSQACPAASGVAAQLIANKMPIKMRLLL
jgi:subtilisin family serine protease